MHERHDRTYSLQHRCPIDGTAHRLRRHLGDPVPARTELRNHDAPSGAAQSAQHRPVRPTLPMGVPDRPPVVALVDCYVGQRLLGQCLDDVHHELALLLAAHGKSMVRGAVTGVDACADHLDNHRCRRVHRPGQGGNQHLRQAYVKAYRIKHTRWFGALDFVLSVFICSFFVVFDSSTWTHIHGKLREKWHVAGRGLTTLAVPVRVEPALSSALRLRLDQLEAVVGQAGLDLRDVLVVQALVLGPQSSLRIPQQLAERLDPTAEHQAKRRLVGERMVQLVVHSDGDVGYRGGHHFSLGRERVLMFPHSR